VNYYLINNEANHQYEFHIDGFIAKIEYIRKRNKIYLTHTEVPGELEGQGIASALVKKVLEDVQQKGFEIFPLCPFVDKCIKRHPEWDFIVFKV
jgi:predicted GNAT family acetyltransferase